MVKRKNKIFIANFEGYTVFEDTWLTKGHIIINDCTGTEHLIVEEKIYLGERLYDVDKTYMIPRIHEEVKNQL
jgi:hypothetical protein